MLSAMLCGQAWRPRTNRDIPACLEKRIGSILYGRQDGGRLYVLYWAVADTPNGSDVVTSVSAL